MCSTTVQLSFLEVVDLLALSLFLILYVCVCVHVVLFCIMYMLHINFARTGLLPRVHAQQGYSNIFFSLFV